MVLDPFTALGLASNICQLIEFSRKLLSGTYEGYKSRDGSLIRRVQLQAAAVTIEHLTADIKSSLENDVKDRYPLLSENKMVEICDETTKLTSGLLGTLRKIAVNSGNRKWKTVREALNMTWNEDKINYTMNALDRLRGDLNTFILILLR